MQGPTRHLIQYPRYSCQNIVCTDCICQAFIIVLVASQSTNQTRPLIQTLCLAWLDHICQLCVGAAALDGNIQVMIVSTTLHS